MGRSTETFLVVMLTTLRLSSPLGSAASWTRSKTSPSNSATSRVSPVTVPLCIPDIEDLPGRRTSPFARGAEPGLVQTSKLAHSSPSPHGQMHHETLPFFVTCLEQASRVCQIPFTVLWKYWMSPLMFTLQRSMAQGIMDAAPRSTGEDSRRPTRPPEGLCGTLVT